MTRHAVARVFSVQARIVALRARHRDLEASIAGEERRPAPDAAQVQALKRQKLCVKDELSRYEGLLRLIERGATPRAAVAPA